MTEALSELTFLRPAFLLMLIWPLWLMRKPTASSQQSDWRRVMDAPLLSALSGESDPRRSAHRPWAQILVLSLAAFALAGPSWRLAPQPMQSNRAALVVVIDLSQGMLAADQKPSRLLHARFRLLDMLQLRAEGQTALVAYAGAAFTVAPLTDDQTTLGELVRGLDPSIMPLDGSNLAEAMQLAGDLLTQAGAGHGDVLVVSYTADPASIEAAAGLRSAGHRVSVFALGSEGGAPIPLQGGGFVRERNGDVLMSRADLERLDALASAGGGSLLPAASEAAQLLAAVSGERLDAATEDGSEAMLRIDDGPWLALLLLPLMAWCLARGRTWVGAIAVVCFWPVPSHAMSWDGLWLRDDQRAHRALLEEDAARARELARDPAIRGSAAYRDGDFSAAAEAFDQRDDADAHYNRGNALARSGALKEALAAYDEALARAPGMEDAAHNRALVEALLREQEQSESSEDESGEKGGQGESEPSESEQAQSGERDEREASEQESADAQQEDEQTGGQDQQTADGEGGKEQPEEGDASEERQAGSDAESDPGQEGHEALSQQIDEALQEGQGDAEQRAGEQQAMEAPAPTAEELERAQATDQWLRRIPDDPGGLLRRKFAVEYRRRLADEDQP